ncbi:MAG: hypothetical protein ACRCX2_19045 [Paraclostridium sp.]
MGEKSFLKVSFKDVSRKKKEGNFLVVMDNKTGDTKYFFSEKLEISKEHKVLYDLEDRHVLNIELASYESAEFLVTTILNNKLAIKKYNLPKI